jgi:hypothetical protein
VWAAVACGYVSSLYISLLWILLPDLPREAQKRKHAGTNQPVIESACGGLVILRVEIVFLGG